MSLPIRPVQVYWLVANAVYLVCAVWNQGSDTGVFPTQKFLTKLLYITQLVRALASFSGFRALGNSISH